MRPIVTDGVAWSVCHDCELGKNSWTNRATIWVLDSGGPKNHVL